MVAYGKNVAVWIFEPRYLVTRGRCPNSEFTILNKGILLESNPFIPKPGCHRFDVFDFPAEDGALQWRETRDLRNANHVPAGIHDQGILIQTHKLKSKLIFIEGTRLVVIPCRNKPNDFSRSEHR